MRTPVAVQKPRIAQPHLFPAPTRGWIANENLADPTPGGAAMVENMAATATGLRVRGGSETYVTLGGGLEGPTQAMFSYLNGLNRKFFGSTNTSTSDITTTTPAQVMTHTNGEWVVIQFATTGGVYLFGVNGVDNAFLYDGTNFFPISGVPVYRLNYDGQTVNFTIGATVTGGTSGATGVILRDSDSGTTGFLTLTGVTGTFQDNETITATLGTAVVNGPATVLAPAITGLATSSLSYVWAYKNRAFFIQKDSLDAWYLPVDSVGGALVKLPLGAVFSRGGSLLFGATWSLDSGASGGLSEQCVFVSTEGEVAVFQGTDPAAAATWSKVGVYRIGRPLGKKAFTRPGGDVLIATDIGYIPLSQAIQKDVAALSPNAVSFPIETAWNQRVALRSGEPWHCEIWPTKQIAVIALPTVTDERPEMLVANVRTGAWSLYTGWDGTCLALFEDRLFFGSEDGKVIEAEVTGSDNGMPYVATCVPLFSDLQNPASIKTVGMARAVLLSPYDVNERISIQADFVIALPPPPDAPAIGSLSVWGLGVWGSSTWGSANSKKPFQKWRSVSGYGYALAPAIQITSGSVPPPNIELVRLEILAQGGDVGS